MAVGVPGAARPTMLPPKMIMIDRDSATQRGYQQGFIAFPFPLQTSDMCSESIVRKEWRFWITGVA
jgi:hypothetical protein